LLPVIVLSWLVIPVQGQAQEKTDQELIQGTWECVITIKEGKQVDQYVGVRAIMQGNRLTWIFPQRDGTTRTTKAVFTLDTTKNPKCFDWYTEDKPAQVHKRLYILEGDTLTWSTNLGMEARPESFEAGKWQFIMKRVK
jgi:uncharacterized protein (TIGR03067 family)